MTGARIPASTITVMTTTPKVNAPRPRSLSRRLLPLTLRLTRSGDGAFATTDPVATTLPGRSQARIEEGVGEVGQQVGHTHANRHQ